MERGIKMEKVKMPDGTEVGFEGAEWYMDDGKQPNAKIIVRSHVHYARKAETPYYIAMTTPALQGHGSKFGSRKCSGTVDIGITYIDVDKEGTPSCGWKIAKLESQRSTPRII